MTSPRILVTHGARATEARLLGDLAALLAPGRQDPRALARPVRVVVPSVSLRNHLAATLVRSFGALAGCQVSTLFEIAREILRRSGRSVGRGAAFPVLVRRAARRQPALHSRLDDLHDGYRVVAASLHDLFDAGFEAVHAEALDELFASPEARLAATPPEIGRARALLRVAREVELAFAELGLGHRAGLYRGADAELRSRGPDLLPTRSVWIHGFADATGVVADLIEGLLQAFDGTALVDRPAPG